MTRRKGQARYLKWLEECPAFENLKESFLANRGILDSACEELGGEHKGLFPDPAEFIRRLYDSYQFARLAEPSALAVNMPGLGGLSSLQSHYLLTKLGDLLFADWKKDTADVGVRDSLSAVLKLGKITGSKFNFDRVMQHLETLPDAKDKMKYLIEIKTEFKQQNIVDQLPHLDFDRKCDLEIKKLGHLMALENSDKATDDAQAQTETATRNSDHTTARQALAVLYLLDIAGIGNGVRQKEIARFIEFLTGKSQENIYKMVRYFPQRENRNDYFNDKLYVKDWFQKLNATHIVKLIDNEIERRNFIDDEEDNALKKTQAAKPKKSKI